LNLRLLIRYVFYLHKPWMMHKKAGILILLVLQAFLLKGTELFELDQSWQHADGVWQQLTQLEALLYESETLDAQELQQQFPELFENVNAGCSSSGGAGSLNSNPLIFASLLWGCCLGLIGLVLVQSIGKDPKETKKALLGCGLWIFNLYHLLFPKPCSFDAVFFVDLQKTKVKMKKTLFASLLIVILPLSSVFAEKLFDFDRSFQQKDIVWEQLEVLEAFLNESEGYAYEDVQLLRPDLLEGLAHSNTLIGNAGPANDNPLFFPSFVWGCCLGPLGLVLVGLITQDSDEMVKALLGMLAWCCILVSGCIFSLYY
jgi:hypothetical protein